MQMLLRSMSPDVVAVDELGKKEDFKAVESVVHCGCKLFATAHGNSLEDILRQPFFQKLRELEVFERYIVLGKKGHAETGGSCPYYLRVRRTGILKKQRTYAT